MFQTTSGFLEALRAPSMQAVVRIVASDGTVLYAQSGSVEMDSRRNIGRTLSIELTPTETLDRDDIYALVTTAGIELSVSRGLIVDGSAELIPLGVFSVDSVTKNIRTVSLQGSDRSKKITRARFTDVYTIFAGTTLADAGTALLQSRWSGMQVDFGNVTETIDTAIAFEAGESSDPWARARDLFADFGYDLSINGSGVARATVVPDPATVDSVFDFGVGETSLMLDPSISTTLDNSFNGVIVTGEGSRVTTPVRGEAWDDDPTSPTFTGRFGRLPKFYSSPLLTTAEACAKAAATLLAKAKGRVEQFTATAVVHPALEPLDVVTAPVDGASRRYVIDKLSIPLRAAEAMSITARETSVA